MTERGIAPVLGVVLLVVIVIVLAGTVAIFLLTDTANSGTPQAAIEATVEAESGEFRFIHTGGDSIHVAELTIEVTIDGVALTHQPAVPFVGATGFSGSPSGPFNSAGSTTWHPGEHASFRVAATNEPPITTGSEIEIVFRVDESPVAILEVTAV